MERSAKLRLIYSIFLSVFTLAVGIALICVAADIYYSGKSSGGVIYSREIVGERLLALSVPLVCLIAAIAVGAVFPLYEVKAGRRPENTVKLLAKKLPASGEGEEYAAADRAYRRARIVRIVAFCVALAIALAAAIAMLCYLADTAHFRAEDITQSILDMVKNVLPWIAAAFLSLVAASIVGGVFAEKQVESMKTLIKTGTGKRDSAPSGGAAALEKAKSVWNSPITLWAVRGAIFVVAVAFVIAGVLNGGAYDVLVKAINICQECIGLG